MKEGTISTAYDRSFGIQCVIEVTARWLLFPWLFASLGITGYVWIVVQDELGDMMRARRMREAMRMDYIGRRESF